MSTPAYDPQTLDNYEPFHKEFGKKEFAIMGAFTAAFAPFGWFIGRDFVAQVMCSQYEGQENSPHVLCGDGLSRCLQRPLRLCNFCSRTHRKETLVQVSLLNRLGAFLSVV